jgi:hypothetical protein
VWIFLLVCWLLRERHAVLAIGTLWFWGFNLTAYAHPHALEGGLTGLLWHLDGDLFCLYAAAAVVALLVREWRRAGGVAGLRAALTAAPSHVDRAPVAA